MTGKPRQVPVQAKSRVQPPVLALIHIALAFLLGWLFPLPFVAPPVVRIAGFLLVVLGFLLGVAALLAFRRAYAGPDQKKTPFQLITGGIYRFSRNPVYLGFLLFLIGMTLNTGSYWGIILAPVMVVLFNRLIIGPEEEYLTSRFGEEFQRYKAIVRRWI